MKDKIYFILILTFILMFSSLVILSAVSGGDLKPFYKHLFAIFLGFMVLFFFSRVNYNLLLRYAWPIYAVSLLLLLFVLIFGKTVYGSKSWFFLGPLSFQPTEMAKLALLIILTKYIERGIGFLMALVFIPGGLILLQPDPGSALIFILIFFAALFLGKRGKISLTLFIGFFLIALGLPLFLSAFTEEMPSYLLPFYRFSSTILFIVLIFLFLFIIFWILHKFRLRPDKRIFFLIFITIAGGILSSYPVRFFLKDYQKKRLIAFINPAFDPLGAGYQIIQSKVAIGSGGVFGKGFFKGTQGKLGFLPVRRKDFIFSLVGEETGFFGAAILLMLFTFLLVKGIKFSSLAKDPQGSYLSSAIVWLFFSQIFINIGMTIGIMPVCGIPLPFMSYGGNALVVSMAGCGILLNISERRDLI